MKIPAECNKCKKKFDLEIDDKDEDMPVKDYLNKRFEGGFIFCPDCEAGKINASFDKPAKSSLNKTMKDV